MPEGLFRGLFDTDLTTVISVSAFLWCLFFSLGLGLIMSVAYMYRTRYTKSFVMTLAMWEPVSLLPGLLVWYVFVLFPVQLKKYVLCF